jgi:hypothetical protein
MSREKLTVGPTKVRLRQPDGTAVELPVANIEREDGQPRTHHPRCPTRPGAPLDAGTICCDCIYGEFAK